MVTVKVTESLVSLSADDRAIKGTVQVAMKVPDKAELDWMLIS